MNDPYRFMLYLRQNLTQVGTLSRRGPPAPQQARATCQVNFLWRLFLGSKITSPGGQRRADLVVRTQPHIHDFC